MSKRTSTGRFLLICVLTALTVNAVYGQRYGGGMHRNGGDGMHHNTDETHQDGESWDGGRNGGCGDQQQQQQQNGGSDNFYGGYHHPCRDRDWQGGHGGRGPGGMMDDTSMWSTLDDCGDEFACTLRNGDVGSFVCRETYHPMTGDVHSMVRCIPTDRAWESDVCGCCDEEEACPGQPFPTEFESMACPEQDDEGDPQNRIMICRHLFDPFTGEEGVEATFLIPHDEAFEGDECGCCSSGQCDHHGEQNLQDQIARPDFANITCAEENLIPCQRSHGDQGGDMSAVSRGVDDETGQFVCRKWHNVRTGEAKNGTVCVTPERTWDTDSCGCCDDECPEQALTSELECLDSMDECELQGSDERGTYVCRSIFHPVTGELYDQTMCIPGHLAWVTDTCGCCVDEQGQSRCPVTPSGGFDNEETQLMQLALEAPEDFGAFSEVDGSTAPSNSMYPSVTFVVAIAMATF